MLQLRCVTTVLSCLLVHLQVADSQRNLVPMWKFPSCQEFVTDAKDCEHFIPIEHMKNYADENYLLQLKVYVFSFHDANFALSSTKDKVDCRIVIGGWNNSMSRLRCYDVDIERSNLRDINSPMWPIPVLIQQTTCGWLSVSIPGLVEPLLSANVSNLNVNYISFYAHGDLNRWFFNCSEEEDKDYQFQTNKCTPYAQCSQVKQKNED